MKLKIAILTSLALTAITALPPAANQARADDDGYVFMGWGAGPAASPPEESTIEPPAPPPSAPVAPQIVSAVSELGAVAVTGSGPSANGGGKSLTLCVISENCETINNGDAMIHNFPYYELNVTVQDATGLSTQRIEAFNVWDGQSFFCEASKDPVVIDAHQKLKLQAAQLKKQKVCQAVIDNIVDPVVTKAASIEEPVTKSPPSIVTWGTPEMYRKAGQGTSSAN